MNLEFHEQAKKLRKDGIPGTLFLIPKYITIVDNLLEQVKVLEDAMHEISGYRFIAHTAGIANIATESLEQLAALRAKLEGEVG